ncbi:fimbrial protein [Burkholderia gladioli]|uniref:fimbrial protein n=1 Tax=Burkholderia gladioli TaxID=28095 RepID=UPI000BBD16A4|nr:fimbrial protein [Burkholderia gladioli]ATF87011.1 fimbrial protein [Burkholderia gladioli pv. gladioli]MBJ9710028.1 type 1 fimbrial protein [Burkholderia gladioli]MBU9154621.1 type 1 fimbrial protein [Burkholderia gladioli]MDR8091233.1 type 1 fimbrial protein [Burkholderia gladioli]MDZ4035784.1 fimbrial protein [Burkholderia gladioli pv. alliicola]
MKQLLFLGAVLTCLVNPAWSANCTSNTSDGSDYFVVHMVGFDPPEFAPGAIPIGGVIYSAKGRGLSFINKKSGESPSYRCKTPIAVYTTGVGMPSDKIYPTSIPNIGMRIISSKGVLPNLSPWPSIGSSWNEQYSMTVELIKTGEITAGGYLSGAYARYRADNDNGEILVEYCFASPVRVQPRVPTCQVATPLVTVAMGTMSTSMFTGIGSRTFARHFEIALRCSGGDPATSTNAWVTLTDASQPGNTSNALSLTRESTASGIGIEIHRDDTVIGFGPDSAAVGNTNQWYMGNIAQGQAGLRVPLTARYVQTGAKVGAGSANARATFTLSYQ